MRSRRGSVHRPPFDSGVMWRSSNDISATPGRAARSSPSLNSCMLLLLLADDLHFGFEDNLLHGFADGDAGAAVVARRQLFIGPELFHGAGEVIDDVGAIELEVVHELVTVLAIELQVLGLAGGSHALDDDAEGVGRAGR